MIHPNTDHDGAPLPAGSAFTQILDQNTLDECARAIGRPLFDYEVKILDSLLVGLRKRNQKLARKEEFAKMHSVDEVVGVFVERVKLKHMQQLADKFLAGI